MSRELGDVLHYFIPESETGVPAPGMALEPTVARLAVPLGERDVVRAAFVWNLAVESTRAGVATTVVAVGGGGSDSLWPAPGAGPLGCELVLCGADDLAAFARICAEVAEERAHSHGGDALVLACLPASWLGGRLDAQPLLRWSLLFATPDARELRRTGLLAERMLQADPDARVGVTIHGVRTLGEARATFLGLAATLERRLGRELRSYGLLLDDLHVYRAIVSLRPIGLVQPQSRAARALRDVARLLIEDARAASEK